MSPLRITLAALLLSACTVETSDGDPSVKCWDWNPTETCARTKLCEPTTTKVAGVSVSERPVSLKVDGKPCAFSYGERRDFTVWCCE